MKETEQICIVDDDTDHCDAMRFLLDSEGYDVRTFSSATDFLNLLETVHCDCLILDFKMPGISGAELLEILKVKDFQAPVIFLTAHADLDMAIKIFKDGAIDLLKKPVDAGKLLKAIGEAIEKTQKFQRYSAGERDFASSKYRLLTQRELQVIELVALGLMNCQVASRLDLSERTIETHRANAYRKLGVSNLAQLRQVLSRVKSVNI